MYNWSHIDEEEMKRRDPEGYRRWRIIQMLNYDMQGERLDKEEVERFWPEIKDEIEPYTRRYIEYLLWGKISLLPTNTRWWNSRRTIAQ